MARRERTICQTPGCNNLQAAINYNPPTWRKYCSQCHNHRTASKKGFENISQVVAHNAGFNNVSEYLNQKAIDKGFDGLTEYRNSYHPYRKYRKDQCENRDGSVLGYKCNHKIRLPGQLQVDHKDGNPHNNDPDNLQTLCMMCHYEKTMINKDYKTPGRKTGKVLDQIQVSTDCLEQSTIA